MHRDNYENVYCQIAGKKHFTLLPPLATSCVNEQWLETATYNEQMELVLDIPSQVVPCAIWDPDRPQANATPFSSLCVPLKVTLQPGDMLYLPTCW